MMRIAVIGAANGIGLATAERLLADGHFVVGVDKESTSLESSQYEHLQSDLGDQKVVLELSCQLIKFNIEHIVYTAAEQHNLSSYEPNLDYLRHIFAVNVFSAWQIIAYLQKHNSTPLKSVVLISSVHAVATSRNMTGYALTKAALTSLVRSLAIDFASQGTRVNGVLPGAVRTRLLTQHIDEEAIRQYSKKQLIDRIAEPSEIAGTIVFLLSDDASYITGQNIIADGGILALLATEA